jgi:CMP-N-acetylneuraminic acid synthetase
MSTLSTDEILLRHNELSNALADLLEERAFTLSTATSIRSQLFASLVAEGHNITSIRERVTHDTAMYEVQTIEQTGHIDGIRARLHCLDQILAIRVARGGV